MTIEVGGASSGGSIWPMPPVPALYGPDGALSDIAHTIPHNGTLVNQVQFPDSYTTAATGDYVGLLDAVTVWTVSCTDINAACDGFLNIISHWYDSVNDRLYVFGIDTGTTNDTIYTAYIVIETGAVTNIGNFALTNQPVQVNTINETSTSRPAIDSGNFTLFFDDYTVVVNESTGAEVSNVASVNVTGSNQIGVYTTLDGTIHLSSLLNFTTPDSYFIISRGGVSIRIATKYNLLFSTNALSSVKFSNWGDKVKVFHNAATANVSMMRTFLRSDFDAWLVLMCDYAGLE